MYRNILLLTITFLLLAACATNTAQPVAVEPSAPATPATDDSSTSSSDSEATTATNTPDAESLGSETTTTDNPNTMSSVTVAFPYIPNIQFAPYYVADSKGYYADAGLEVTFEYMFEDEAMQLIAQKEADFGFVNGIAVLLARQSDLPVVTVATITREFPVVFFSKAEQNIKGIEDLQDKRIGIPGHFGASYYGMLAALYANDMQESDLNIQDIGFNQIPLISEDKVDVAVGYAVNEPLQLRTMGEEIDVLRVADIYPLVSDGIITNEELVASNPDMVQAFVTATLRGVQDTLDDPDEAFTLSLAYIPEADLGNADLQREVLQENLAYWEHSEQIGYNDPNVWKKTYTFLRDSQLLTRDIPLEESYTNTFVQE